MIEHPLKRIGAFCPHDGTTLDLPDVTTITIDDRKDSIYITQLSDVTKWHRRFLKPAREVIVSGSRPDVDDIDWVKIERWNGTHWIEYSLWCQKELRNHFSTPFVLVWQADGFALDPGSWSDEFYRYDYIGAPFCFDANAVGNGGFSLRSKQFCEAVSRLPDCGSKSGEDVYFCVDNRDTLVESGISFAPPSVANRWSVETWPDWHPDRPQFPLHLTPDILCGRFGFHSKNLFNIVSQYLEKWRLRLLNGTRWNGRGLVRR